MIAPAETRVARIMARDGIPEAYARLRVRAQKDEAFYRARCTDVLVNDCGQRGGLYGKGTAGAGDDIEGGTSMSEEMKALREQLLRNDKNGYDTLDEAQLREMEAYCADYKAFS